MYVCMYVLPSERSGIQNTVNDKTNSKETLRPWKSGTRNKKTRYEIRQNRRDRRFPSVYKLNIEVDWVHVRGYHVLLQI